MLIGAYWPARKESREQAAERIALFLRTLSSADPMLATWYLKARTRAAANVPLHADPAEIGARLKANLRDVDKAVIPDLGFSLGAWNGGGVSLWAHLGAYSRYVGNAVVLEFDA